MILFTSFKLPCIKRGGFVPVFIYMIFHFDLGKMMKAIRGRLSIKISMNTEAHEE